MVKCSWMAGLREKAGWTSRSSKSSSLQDQSSHQLGKDVAAATALRSSTYVDSQLLQSGSSYRPALDDIEDRPSPLFTPARSSAVSPSGKPEDDNKTLGLARQAQAAAKKSSAEIKVNALIFRLTADRKHPIDPSSSVEEIRERDETAKREPFIARANTVPTYLECNRYVSRRTPPPNLVFPRCDSPSRLFLASLAPSLLGIRLDRSSEWRTVGRIRFEHRCASIIVTLPSHAQPGSHSTRSCLWLAFDSSSSIARLHNHGPRCSRRCCQRSAVDRCKSPNFVRFARRGLHPRR